MFEISRGRTDSPLRPINRDRFLIGSGERCDLRLGGQDVPAVHSVVHIDGDQIWLEALAESPEVRVNGRLTRSAALEPGDALEIGSFCLTLHRTSSVQPVPAPRIHGARVSEILTEEESADLLDIEDLSARELVDLIEQEEALIEEFESRRQMGAQALLDVLNQRFGPDVSDDSQTVDATPDTRQLLHELQMAIISLNEFAQDFEQRTDRLSQRDTHRAANSLLDFQKQIVSRLDGVLEKIACIDEADRRRMPRRDVA
ncbi:MAG: FHA domain-containing protein [Planctomycetota bacterium]|nr:FHA domain-containing protein [Planctomycetota bacterium]